VSILSEHPHSHGVHEFLLYPLAGVEAFKLLVYDPMALLLGYFVEDGVYPGPLLGYASSMGRARTGGAG
jgi:hypothetical protein